MPKLGQSFAKVAFISSFLPSKCAIATFTSDLSKNLRLAGGEDFEPAVFVIRSDPAQNYQKPVKFRMHRDIRYDFLAAANYINLGGGDIVSVQHEFGLFGAEAGCYLNLLLKRLRKPVTTTLHTVLEKPSAASFDALARVCPTSDTVVLMNKRGLRMLRKIYSVPGDKISLVPHLQ
ncbi:MAG TPA: hypothetical protein VMW16_07655 [Sedimentisphaerales bacterium]|nr:hypothetical protein [Sedimentisphaerales bacterium]